MGKIGTIDSPKFPDSIPSHSQWLSGQGAGVWFCIDKTECNDQFKIKRFNPSGILDCERVFQLEDNGANFNINQPYQFVHISHCSKCRIKQRENIFIFNFI